MGYTTELISCGGGKVDESARVFVNGVEAGLVWANPFELDITKHVRKGQNTLRIEVANLMAKDQFQKLWTKQTIWSI